MTGEELYALYQAAHADQNCIVDTWDEMTPEERMVWGAMADAAHPTAVHSQLTTALDALECAFAALGRLGANTVKFRERGAWEISRRALQDAGRIPR